MIVQYKLISSGLWLDKQADEAKTELTVDNLQPGQYSVRLSVSNNENIKSESDIVTYTVGSEYEFELHLLCKYAADFQPEVVFSFPQ